MNLYAHHTDPESIHGFKKAQTTVPQVVWDKYKNNPRELKNMNML